MKEDKNNFYQSKFEYYKKYATWLVIFSVIASLTYFISDCQICEQFSSETFIPRFSIIIPLIIFLIVNKKVKDYKILVNVMYLVLHCIMWCTIWSIYYLPIKQHANEGFIIMHLMFLSMAFCAPIYTSTAWHCLLIVDILVSNTFNHYENLALMLSLGIPCLIGICISNYVMQQAYLDQYKTKNELITLLTKDPLTNAYNRKKFIDVCYKDTYKLQIADDKDIYIAILDIDFFKKVNDTYGHSIGDNVLKNVVKTIQSCIRKDDYVVRWGGEEFVAVFMNANYENAISITERIRCAIEKSENFEPKVTVSIGICKYNGNDYQATITCADSALYKAKQTGRNKIMIYKQDDTICDKT